MPTLKITKCNAANKRILHSPLGSERWATKIEGLDIVRAIIGLDVSLVLWRGNCPADPSRDVLPQGDSDADKREKL